MQTLATKKWEQKNKNMGKLNTEKNLLNKKYKKIQKIKLYLNWFVYQSVVKKSKTFKISLTNEIEKTFHKVTLCKWRIVQLVIQLITTSVKKHGTVVHVIKTWTLIVELDILIIIFTSAENDLLSLLKKWIW